MAEIVELKGNIFLTQCEVITVTVNCDGVMGAGIALEGRLRWPAMFNAYAALCEHQELRPGRLYLWEDPAGPPHQRVLCFPTKDRWRAPSELSYVRAGIDNLAQSYRQRGIHSIAMPHLGCSKGGLAWSEVEPLVRNGLRDCDDLRVELWEFDARSADPWFDRLRETAAGAGAEPTQLAKQLDLTTTQATALIRALRNRHVTGLASLQEATGVGVKTLEAVYRFLFGAQGQPATQLELF